MIEGVDTIFGWKYSRNHRIILRYSSQENNFHYLFLIFYISLKRIASWIKITSNSPPFCVDLQHHPELGFTRDGITIAWGLEPKGESEFFSRFEFRGNRK